MRGVFVGTPLMNHSFQSSNLFLKTHGRGVISSLTCLSCPSPSGLGALLWLRRGYWESSRWRCWSDCLGGVLADVEVYGCLLRSHGVVDRFWEVFSDQTNPFFVLYYGSDHGCEISFRISCVFFQSVNIEM